MVFETTERERLLNEYSFLKLICECNRIIRCKFEAYERLKWMQNADIFAQGGGGGVISVVQIWCHLKILKQFVLNLTYTEN